MWEYVDLFYHQCQGKRMHSCRSELFRSPYATWTHVPRNESSILGERAFHYRD